MKVNGETMGVWGPGDRGVGRGKKRVRWLGENAEERWGSDLRIFGPRKLRPE